MISAVARKHSRHSLVADITRAQGEYWAGQVVIRGHRQLVTMYSSVADITRAQGEYWAGQVVIRGHRQLVTMYSSLRTLREHKESTGQGRSSLEVTGSLVADITRAQGEYWAGQVVIRGHRQLQLRTLREHKQSTGQGRSSLEVTGSSQDKNQECVPITGPQREGERERANSFICSTPFPMATGICLSTPHRHRRFIDARDTLVAGRENVSVSPDLPIYK
ncbi:hypothetical protein J6590_008463 [Homalodisca vitripennis]|nr:hypothetical protein J6590_008463 [Homalodisca vitripennis]